MDLSFSEQDRAFQAEVRSFLEEAWPQEIQDKKARSALGKLSKDDLVGWQKRLAEKAGRQPTGQQNTVALPSRQRKAIFGMPNAPVSVHLASYHSASPWSLR